MKSCVCILRAPAAALAASLLAAACVLTPPAPPAEPAARQAVDRFLLMGRLSATDGEHSATGRLEWQHRPDADRWTVFNPLGQIVARIEDGQDGAELTLASGEHRHAPQAADLISGLFPGIVDANLPPARLAVWIQAAPPADAEVRTLDAQGRPARAIDQGWSIDYLAYRDETPGALPRLLDIFRGDFRLRLTIDQWETP
ncbi:MAG: lipoprotein insertase outer membrane protein LolB [Azoarcus sp.]|nr:lipoprotein insertase outer membrane protein LolB [Azoarcus sp.]